MKENCPISPAAWFKFHFNQIGGRDKCQLVLLPYIDLRGKGLHLITCMLWFSSTPKILGCQIGKSCWLLNHIIASPVQVSCSSSSFSKNRGFFPSRLMPLWQLREMKLCGPVEEDRDAAPENSPSGDRTEAQTGAEGI